MTTRALPVLFLLACVAPPGPPKASSEAPEAPPLPDAETSSRRTSIALEVASVPEALQRLTETLNTRGGYETLRQMPDAQARDGTGAGVTFQVDMRQAAFLESFLLGLGTVIAIHREVSDATAPMVEASARLQALRESEARLRRLLDDPSTTCPERVSAETEQRRVLGEISEVAAQLKVLEFRSQYAAFAVRLLPPRAAAQQASLGVLLGRIPAAWARVVQDPGEALQDGLVTFFASLPWLLLFSGVLWRLRRPRGDGAGPRAS